MGLLLPIYNIAPQAGNTFGVLHSEETKARMKAQYSDKRREQIGSLNRGKSLAPSTVEKIRQAALNRAPMSDATKAKVSANSTVAQLFRVSHPLGHPFISPDGVEVTSTVIRTVPAVAKFIKCDEKNSSASYS